MLPNLGIFARQLGPTKQFLLNRLLGAGPALTMRRCIGSQEYINSVVIAFSGVSIDVPFSETR